MENNTNIYNKYYEIINSKIEEYIKDHKVTPKKLKKYFNSERIDNLIKKLELSEVKGIKTVVNDIIDDWTHIQSDGVLKFESFILNEDMGVIAINKSGQSYERVLADLYRTSVGHIEPISEEEHKYKVNDLGEEINVVIFSEQDLIKFKKDIIPVLTKVSVDSQVDIHKVDLGLKSGKEVKTAISFNIQEIVDDKKLQAYFQSTLNKEKTINIVGSFINDIDILKRNKIYKYKTEYSKHYIWELNDKPSVVKK